MMIPNMIMKSHNLDIFFTNFVTILTCRLHSPAAWKAFSIKYVNVFTGRPFRGKCTLNDRVITQIEQFSHVPLSLVMQTHRTRYSNMNWSRKTCFSIGLLLNIPIYFCVVSWLHTNDRICEVYVFVIAYIWVTTFMAARLLY